MFTQGTSGLLTKSSRNAQGRLHKFLDAGRLVQRAARSRVLLVACLLAAMVAARCAPRAPVLNLPPQYPDFVFPAVPAELAATPQTAQHARAWQLLQAGDLRSATVAFTDVLSRAPAFYPAEAGLGYVAMAQQSYDTAVERFTRALDRSPVYVPALLGRGEAYLASDRIDEALRSFEAAVKADPRLTAFQRRVEELRFNRMTTEVTAARRAVDAGRYGEARAAYERVIAASPDSAFLYLELAQVEQRERNLTRALELATKAADLDPADVAPLVVQGELYEADGDLASAERAYQRALDLDPTVDVDERLERIRDRVRLASLPAQYRGIPGKTRIVRGELAALVGVRFEALMDDAGRGRTIIVTDTRNHWATRWILAVATARIHRVAQ